MSSLINVILIVMIFLLIAFLLLYRLLTNSSRVENKEVVNRDFYQIENVQKIIQNEISTITSINLYNQGYTPEEFERQNRRMKELKEALRNCNTGDYNSKVYVVDFILDILKNDLDYDETSVNYTIPFNNAGSLTHRDKFDILLYVYSKKSNKKALGQIIDTYKISKPTNDGGYEFSDVQLDSIYAKESFQLTFEDKLKIIAQRVYAQYKGFGIIDEIRDMAIDGVSGGVSGQNTRFNDFDDDSLFDLKSATGSSSGLNSVFVMYKGNTIHFSFLEFSSEAELRRIVSNVYKYNAPGQLSESNPRIVNEMADHSRVVVARPPFTESWLFLIRKKYDAKRMDINKIVTHENAELAIETLEFLTKGSRTVGYTGAQGSGKTTLMMAIIAWVHGSLNIRTVESFFELNLRKLFPQKNIIAFQETANINGQDALDFTKKTDGDVTILGEVASNEVASQMIQLGQLSLFTLFTHHAKTATLLVEAIRNSLKETGAFSDEISAERQVVDVLEFNVHLKKDYDGTRYIERITQIIPIEPKENELEMLEDLSEDEQLKKLQIMSLKKQFQNKTFTTKNIIEYRDGRYVAINRISDEKVQEMTEKLSPEDAIRFEKYLTTNWAVDD